MLAKVGGRSASPAVRVRVGGRAGHEHRVLVPGIVVRQRHLDQALAVVGAMAEPVVQLELEPGRGQQVEDRGRLEALPGEQRG